MDCCSIGPCIYIYMCVCVCGEGERERGLSQTMNPVFGQFPLNLPMLGSFLGCHGLSVRAVGDN